MAAGRSAGGVTLNESEISGAKLTKNVEELSRAEAERWLKCRGCRNLSECTLNVLKSKYVYTSVIVIVSMLRLSKLGQENAKLVLMGYLIFFIIKNQLGSITSRCSGKKPALLPRTLFSGRNDTRERRKSSLRINSYIKYGWDKLLLKDPDGKLQEEKRKGNMRNVLYNKTLVCHLSPF